jgi:IMP dehydrogenase/GMP reductase
MKFDETEHYCFDDVLLVPQYSEIESRKDIDISTEIVDIKLRTPIISANMDSITEEAMAEAMYECGSLGILHRYSSAEKIEERIRKHRKKSQRKEKERKNENVKKDYKDFIASAFKRYS